MKSLKAVVKSLAVVLVVAIAPLHAAVPVDPSALITATRTVPNDAASDIVLAWKAASIDAAAIDIYAGNAAGATIDEMVLITHAIPAVSATWRTSAFDNVRPYFSITPAAQKTVLASVAVRLLPLAGGRNYRDLGGYPAADGRRVRWGKLYRSGVMHRLSDADYDFLDALGIRVVCDYRSIEERAGEPTDWRAPGTQYVSWDYSSDEDSSVLAALFAGGEVTPQKSRQALIDLYPQLLETHKARFAAMFEHLLAGDVPLTFNCSAGKDRTGVSAALLLSALGVPREIVIYDYSLSDDYVDYMAEYATQMRDPDSPYGFLAQLPPAVLAPLLASDPDYISAVLDMLDAEYGGVIEYLKAELSLSDRDIRRLRDNLLTR